MGSFEVTGRPVALFEASQDFLGSGHRRASVLQPVLRPADPVDVLDGPPPAGSCLCQQLLAVTLAWTGCHPALSPTGW